jgi:hypothetical protein
MVECPALSRSFVKILKRILLRFDPGVPFCHGLDLQIRLGRVDLAELVLADLLDIVCKQSEYVMVDLAALHH